MMNLKMNQSAATNTKGPREARNENDQTINDDTHTI